MSTRPSEIVIDDSTPSHLVMDPTLDGERKGRGLVPRDYFRYPVGSYDGIKAMRAVSLPNIPRSEWSDRIKEGEANKSFLSHVRLRGNNGQMIPSLDQDGVGYCWAHSSTHGHIIARALQNDPYIPLSAFMVASIIKNGRDEGGWGAQSADFIIKNGQCDQKYWPQKDRSLKHDTAEMRANAALHKVVEGWIDLDEAQYDRNLTWDQVITCLLLRIPVVGDFNWWGHSILLLDPVEVEPGSFGVRIWNSWGDSWSDRGMGILRGSKAIPDGAVGLRTATPSIN
jgi:hypothetical protein